MEGIELKEDEIWVAQTELLVNVLAGHEAAVRLNVKIFARDQADAEKLLKYYDEETHLARSRIIDALYMFHGKIDLNDIQ